jgi:hypothetical protein
VDRYIRIRSKHAQAWRPQLWLGVNNRGPITANGIYQMIARRGHQRGVDAWPHRLDAAPLRRQRPQRPGPPHLRPNHGDQPLTPFSSRADIPMGNSISSSMVTCMIF